MQRSEAEAAEAMNGVEEVKEEGEFDPNETQPAKIHVRGLDKLNTTQIEQWVGEYVPIDLFKRVQWIDDTSANLIFDTELAASDALNSLSAVEVFDPLELRRAKELSTHPDQVLEVRQAVVTDVKAKGAKDRSAFYLFNPDWDPDNPHNVRQDSRKRRWADDGGRERNKYRRREWEDDRLHRRESRDQGNFTEDMYDEGAAGTASAPPESRRTSSSNEYARRRVNLGEDLFASQQTGRLRDRSASPGRDGDGRYGFSEDQPRRRTARPRSATPPGLRKNRDNRTARGAASKELFPDKAPTSALTTDLFSDRPSTPKSNTGPRELFPDKQGTPNHRRQDGRDLPLDEVVHFMGRSNIGRQDGYGTYSSRNSGARPSTPRASYADRDERERDRGRGKDLFARINGTSEGRGSGRLSRDGDDEDAGFSIKGSARNGGGGDQGFSFLGASKEGQRKENPLVKELFPMRNEGRKDLFDGRVKGRASGRRRAEDLF